MPAIAYFWATTKKIKCRGVEQEMLNTMLIMASAIAGQSGVVSHDVDYKDGEDAMTGFVAMPSHVNPSTPAVMIVHQWMGLTDYEKGRAKQIAALGYIAFACDIYGSGIRPTSSNHAGNEAGKYKSNRQLFRQRLLSGLKEMRKIKGADRTRCAAIGYCFGGTGVIELARTGANLKGVVSFHGGLDSPTPADGANIRAKVLICAGADDPFEKPEDLAAFKSEMTTNNVNMNYIAYPGAVHAFTQPMAGDDPSKGAAYNAAADKQSWAAMKSFLAKCFGRAKQ